MYFNREPDLAACTRQELSTGTGFIYRSSYQYFLVTARHNLTGRHPDTNKLIAATGGIPNEVFVEGYFNRANIQLYSRTNDPNDPENCRPHFQQHPTDPTIDVAVLPFTSQTEWSMAWDKSFFDQRQFVKLAVTQTCFVVGFPLGLVDRPDQNHLLPIYKTANIASEPYVDFQGKPVVVIDATTRPGMSGSPVVVQEPHYGSYRHRLVGIYTGRFPRLEKGDDPALGIVYKPKVIQEIFANIDA